MLNGHKQSCPKCHKEITELKISYMDYVSMGQEQRNHFAAVCANDKELGKLSTTYRMYKYSKWYKELYVLPERTSMEHAVSMG